LNNKKHRVKCEQFEEFAQLVNLRRSKRIIGALFERMLLTMIDEYAVTRRHRWSNTAADERRYN